MEEKTIINPLIEESPPTLINEVLYQNISKVAKGTKFFDKYVVEYKLNVSSTEADLYLCVYEDKKYVAKIYKRQFAIKQEVVDKLLSIDSPYVAKIFEIGKYDGYRVEILPYFENGSLKDKKYSYEELCNDIIPNINEGLKVIHDVGIIHKDLKPSNIMINQDGKSISIIDFGISSNIEEEDSIVITKTGMTPVYSAPETFNNIFSIESDYYSLGITLFELFYGYVPYTKMSKDEILQYITIQKLPFPDEIPQRLKDLIYALTYRDITNKDDKDNPNRRWGYEEIKKWLRGEHQIIPGELHNQKDYLPPFEFLGKKYTRLNVLITALAKNWKEGKRLLFRGILKSYFENFNEALAQKCYDAENNGIRKNGKDDIIFWQLLYQLNPELEGFYWKELEFENISAFGRDILEKLWEGDNSLYEYYNDVLNEKVLSLYVEHMYPQNEKLKKAVKAIEEDYQLKLQDKKMLISTYYYMGYVLSGQKIFKYHKQDFRTIDELVNYMKDVLSKSQKEFFDICHELVDYHGNLNCQLETWLTAIGRGNEINNWKTLIIKGNV